MGLYGTIQYLPPEIGAFGTEGGVMVTRRSATWMTIWDDRLLEVIREKGSGSPKELADTDYIRVSRQHVSRRLSTLADHGLLDHLGNGVYVLTEKGNRYLEGELDAAELPDKSEENGGATA